ncbi:hypothetical protein ABBQ32_007321 [Trebouxia sp. C0010 RCD-2024]
MRRRNKQAAEQEETAHTSQEGQPKSAGRLRTHGAVRMAFKPLQFAKNGISCCLRLTWWQCLIPLLTFGLACYGAFALRSRISAMDWVRPGLDLRAEGLRPKHPVVVVPGFVTSGLELWHGHKCAQDFFRQRIWGSFTMTHSFLRNSSCWFEHMQLDMETGMDPEDAEIKLRAATGLEAVDFFMPGYHVWAKLIESLADLGYDSNNLVGVTYDWRLAVPLLQRRDGYFSKLKGTIESTVSLHNVKAVVLSHSWGDNVFRNYMRWAENEEKGWCDKHIEAYVNIAGPVLGVPKAVSACMSGEMRDTAELGSMAALMTEHWMPRNTRANLFRSWGSLIGMLPVGGPNIWGNTTWAPDDTPVMADRNQTHGCFFSRKEGPYNRSWSFAQMKEAFSARSATDWLDWGIAKISLKQRRERRQKFLDHDIKPMTIDDAMSAMLEVSGKQFKKNVELYGAIHTDELSGTGAKQWPEKEFLNPLKDPLPDAPNMRIYCMYGVGAPAERSYHYQHVDDTMQLSNEDRQQAKRNVGREDMKWKVNVKVHDPEIGLERGVRTSDGDGTVPLVSTGLMCHKGWRTKRLNPANIPIVSREYIHQPSTVFKDLRGGPLASTHVESLGNVNLMADVVKVAAGVGHILKDDIHSRIPEIAAHINCFDDDTC